MQKSQAKLRLASINVAKLVGRSAKVAETVGRSRVDEKALQEVQLNDFEYRMYQIVPLLLENTMFHFLTIIVIFHNSDTLPNVTKLFDNFYIIIQSFHRHLTFNHFTTKTFRQC